MTPRFNNTVNLDQFLKNDWQQRPVLLRQLYPAFNSPISQEELAGLAGEPNVESRIVLEKHGKAPWELRQGPFTAAAFRKLPRTHWTLLVQAVDHWLPDIASLLDDFRFLPNWLLDDIMISYAADQGSVGPHFDRYDVFLIQAHGNRLWKVGQQCADNEAVRDDTPLCILKSFQQTEEWLLEPGDVLYLPPGVAHWGIAQGECMTFSVGFRTPAMSDILGSYADHAGENLPESTRFTPTITDSSQHPAAINDAVLAALRERILATLDNPGAMTEWFGRYCTEPKHSEQLTPLTKKVTVSGLRKSHDNGKNICRNEGSRFCWYAAPENTLQLFVDGQRYNTVSLVADWKALCEESPISPETISHLLQDDASTALLCELINRGSLYLT